MHSGQQGLTKLNLASMAYDEVVDLKPFSCVPLAVNFSPLGGTVFVQCANARAESLHFQLVMDLITSQVIIVFVGSAHYLSQRWRMVQHERQ